MGGDLTRADAKFNGRPSLSRIYSVNLLYKVEMACCLIRYDFLEVYVLFHGPSGQEKGFKTLLLFMSIQVRIDSFY